MTKQVDEIPLHQKTAAFKKWFGIEHLLDHLPSGPTYGLMLDADIRLFNTSDCGPKGRWSRLLQRIRQMEAKREWLGIPHKNETLERLDQKSNAKLGNTIR